MIERFFLDNLTYATFLSIDYGKSSGSGFRLRYKNSKFLVTAKHVLFNEEGVLRGENLLITSQNSRSLLHEALTIEVNLKSANVLVSPNEDIAAILLEKNTSQQEKSLLIDDAMSQFVPEPYVTIQQAGIGDAISINCQQTSNIDQIIAGNEVFLIGFPTSLVFQNTKYFDVNKPLLRKGIISGINVQDNTFIVDCSAYYGNSGAPIFEVCRDEKLRAIGLVSKYIPFVTEWKNNREPSISHIEYSNSGYSVCIPMDSVFRLLDINYIEYLALIKLGQQ